MAMTSLNRALIGLVALGLTATSAQAQAVCGQRDAILDRLAAHYGETRRGMGLGANNGIVEVFASDETGTWTITVTSPNGGTGLVASGQAFEELAEALPAKGNDA